MTFAAPAYVGPTATAPNPTEVMGKRVTAFFIDVVLVFVLAGAVGGAMWFGSATKVENTGSEFCSRYGFESSSISDEVYDAVGYDAACFEVGDDVAYVASGSDTGQAWAVTGLVSLLIPFNLFVLQGITGASAGNHLLGLRVVRSDGSIVGFGWNALRTLLLWVATALNFLCFAGWIAEMIVAGATKNHQRVGDMASGTFVVAKGSVGTPIAGTGAAPATWQAPNPTQPWGTGQPAGAPTWQTGPGSPQGATPEGMGPQAGAPQWGTSATPQASETPTAAAATNEPAVTEASAGWASPSPETVAPTAAAPQNSPAAVQQPAMNLPPGAEMRWDDRWNAWLYWDPNARRWLRHDTASNQWIPM